MTDKSLRVFDPAMCCSTGVCGPDVDPELARFAADLDWVAKQGVKVERFNLAQQPGAFASEPVVKAALETDGQSALPMVLLGARSVMSGAYPTRQQLSGWLGLALRDEPMKSEGCCGKKSGCC